MTEPITTRQALQNAAEALRRGDKKNARHWAEIAAALSPGLEDPWLMLAAVSGPRASIAHLNRALKINPASPRARKGMHWARERLQKAEETARQLRAAHPVAVAATARKSSSRLNLRIALFIMACLAVTLLPIILPAGVAAVSRLIPAVLPVEIATQTPAATQLPPPALTDTPAALPTQPPAPATATVAPTILPSDTATDAPTAAPSATSTDAPTQSSSPTDAPVTAELPTETSTSLPTLEVVIDPLSATAVPVIPTLQAAVTLAADRAYTIQPGDTLSKIASRFGADAYALAAYNKISLNSTIYPGQTLYIPDSAYAPPAPEPATVSYGGGKRILVDISEQHLYAYEGDVLVYSFVASTGMNNATRVGTFAVQSKIPNAYGSTWNIWMPNWLGIYWAGSLENGIHALPILPNGQLLWAGYLGTPISYGCVVLGTYESGLLYSWAEVGTPVIIQW
jgi:LysM repeat protein